MYTLLTNILSLAARLLAAATFLAIGAIAIDYARVLHRRRSLPPGPFPWPLVGNHFQTPKDRPWIAWEQWAKDYNSSLMTLWVGREPRLIVSDAWTACELMEKRADIFSSRPHLIAMGDAINLTGKNQTVLPYGDRWRLHRRLMVCCSNSVASSTCLTTSPSTLRLAHKPSVRTEASKQMNPKSSSETSWRIRTITLCLLKGTLFQSRPLSDGAAESTAKTTLSLNRH